MDSWWQLGEGAGYNGETPALHEITCPFCMERGNFKYVAQFEKKKPNGEKRLHFDTLECGNCKGYVQVLWSSNEYGHGRGIHEYRVQPWPLRFEQHSDYWPANVGRYWLQAKRNIRDENWDAAAVMARSALQIALRDQNAKGSKLKQEIDDLAAKGVLPPIMKEWSDHVRELGNDSAHPEPSQGPTNPQDARDIVRFLDFLLEYLYGLPHQIEQYRERANRGTGNATS